MKKWKKMVWTIGCFIVAASGVISALDLSPGIWWRVVYAVEWVVWVGLAWLLMLATKGLEKTARMWENKCTGVHRVYRSQIELYRLMVADLRRQLEVGEKTEWIEVIPDEFFGVVKELEKGKEGTE